MTCAVYWIRCADHTDMFSQGYIGVSKNVQRRFVEHQRKTENAHLKSAILKYGWGALIKTEILIAAARAYVWSCPHCQTTGHGRGAANRWHFDNCKHKE